jgi:hypothetical protein
LRETVKLEELVALSGIGITNLSEHVDEFKAHPNNVNILRQTYIDIMAEIAESTMLEFILSAIQKTPIQIEKYSKDLGDLIRESEYALS